MKPEIKLANTYVDRIPRHIVNAPSAGHPPTGNHALDQFVQIPMSEANKLVLSVAPARPDVWGNTSVTYWDAFKSIPKGSIYCDRDLFLKDDEVLLDTRAIHAFVDGNSGTITPLHNTNLLNWVAGLDDRYGYFLAQSLRSKRSQIKQDEHSYGHCSGDAALALIAANCEHVGAFARIVVAGGHGFVKEIRRVSHGNPFCSPACIRAAITLTAAEMLGPSPRGAEEVIVGATELVAYALHSHKGLGGENEATSLFTELGQFVVDPASGSVADQAQELGYRMGVFASGLFKYSDDVLRKDRSKKHLAETVVHAISTGLASAVPAAPVLAFIAPGVDFIGANVVNALFHERDFSGAVRRWAGSLLNEIDRAQRLYDAQYPDAYSSEQKRDRQACRSTFQNGLETALLNAGFNV